MVTETEHSICLTTTEVSLLWQILNQVSIPGQVAEVFVGLKVKVREEMKKLESKEVH